MKDQIEIVGYEQDGHCEHCGRKLRHCIRIDDGRIVGATCFDQKLTLPLVYQGKKYRIGPENVIRYARLRERFNASALQSRFGLGPSHFVFAAAPTQGAQA